MERKGHFGGMKSGQSQQDFVLDCGVEGEEAA